MSGIIKVCFELYKVKYIVIDCMYIFGLIGLGKIIIFKESFKLF